MKGKNWESFVFLLPLLIGGVLYFLLLKNTTLYERIGMEDGVLEWAQFIFYFLSFCLSTLLAFKLRKDKLIFVIYLFLSLGLLFIALEEISWGERIFGGILPTTLAQRNVQGEINIHNIDSINGKIGYLYILIGFVGCFSWLAICIFKKIFFLKNSFVNTMEKIVPSYIFFFYFFPLFINLITNYGFRPQDYESVEFILALGIFMYLLDRSKERITFSEDF